MIPNMNSLEMAQLQRESSGIKAGREGRGRGYKGAPRKVLVGTEAVYATTHVNIPV